MPHGKEELEVTCVVKGSQTRQAGRSVGHPFGHVLPRGLHIGQIRGPFDYSTIITPSIRFTREIPEFLLW
jgi:hypothetical protein